MGTATRTETPALRYGKAAGWGYLKYLAIRFSSTFFSRPR
jgi:hypothetical protein